MRLGIMQPYFFPYIGHFSLIAAVDQWIVFDITQYTPKTWMNRNRILHPKSGWQYIVVPISNASISIKTSEAKIADALAAKNTITGKLTHYKYKAPYFDAVSELVRQTFESLTGNSLVELNVCGLRFICDYLKIPFNVKVCSELKLEYPENMRAGDWAPHICKELGATEYVNPISGRELFNPDDFSRRGVTLYFAESREYVYDTSPYHYENSLSILDTLMWNAPESVRKELDAGTCLYHAQS